MAAPAPLLPRFPAQAGQFGKISYIGEEISGQHQLDPLSNRFFFFNETLRQFICLSQR
jgi:hypothetical protein